MPQATREPAFRRVGLLLNLGGAGRITSVGAGAMRNQHGFGECAVAKCLVSWLLTSRLSRLRKTARQLSRPVAAAAHRTLSASNVSTSIPILCTCRARPD